MSKQTLSVLVTGASGTVGRRLIALLLDQGLKVVAANRSGGSPNGAEERVFDWLDPDTHAAALEGVRRMYLIPPVPNTDLEAAMIPFLHLARRAGVERVVLQSNSATPSGGRGIGQVHRAVSELFVEWAVLRPSWFMQNVCGTHLLAQMLRRSKRLVTATGTARIAFISAEDVARVGSTLLVSEGISNSDPILTGPEGLNYDAVAQILAKVSGISIRHDAVDASELVERYKSIGIPEKAAVFLQMMDAFLATGAEDRTTDAVQQITGTAARSYDDFAAAEFRL